MQCMARSGGASKHARLPPENVFAVEAVTQHRLRANGQTDGVERALRRAQQVRFDVGVFLCHCNGRFALRGELELPVTVRVALATAGDPLLEQALRVTVEKANHGASEQALGESHGVTAPDLEHPLVDSFGPRQEGPRYREAHEKVA